MQFRSKIVSVTDLSRSLLEFSPPNKLSDSTLFIITDCNLQYFHIGDVLIKESCRTWGGLFYIEICFYQLLWFFDFL